MNIQFEIFNGRHKLSPYKFHLLPVITFMWHRVGADTLYIGWLVFTLRIQFH